MFLGGRCAQYMRLLCLVPKRETVIQLSCNKHFVQKLPFLYISIQTLIIFLNSKIQLLIQYCLGKKAHLQVSSVLFKEISVRFSARN